MIIEYVINFGNLFTEGTKYSFNGGYQRKISTINEAVLYFSFLDANVRKILCLKKSVHIKKQGSFAEYYVRTYGHLLRDITVYEIDESTQEIKKLSPLP